MTEKNQPSYVPLYTVVLHNIMSKLQICRLTQSPRKGLWSSGWEPVV